MDLKSNTSETETKNSVDVLDIPPLKESLKIVYSCLDKACIKGTFTLDEAYLLKLSCNNLSQAVITLNECQNILIDISNNNKNKGKKTVDPASQPTHHTEQALALPPAPPFEQAPGPPVSPVKRTSKQ